MLTESELEARRKGIGSSEIGVLAGHSLYRNASPIRIWESKLYGAHGSTTDAMMLGNIFEPGICQWYLANTDATGLRAVKARARVHPKRKWQRATPDYYIYYGRRRLRVLECKLVGSGMDVHWNPNDPRGIPDMVYDQVIWQMDVCGIGETDVAAIFTGQRKGYIWRIPFDETHAANLREIAEAWWTRHIINQEPPPIDGSDSSSAYLQRTHGKQGYETVAAPVEAEEIVFRYKTWLEAEDIAQEGKELAANQLKAIIGDDAAIRGRWGVASWLEQRGHVSWKQVATVLMQMLQNQGASPDFLQGIVELNRGPSERVLRVKCNDSGRMQ